MNYQISRVLIVFFFCILGLNLQAQTRFQVGAGLGFDFKSILRGETRATLQFRNSNWRLTSIFDFHNFYTNSEARRRWLGLTLDVNYMINIKSKIFKPYFLLGAYIGDSKFRDHPAPNPEIVSNTEFGMSYGLGMEFNFRYLSPYIELRAFQWYYSTNGFTNNEGLSIRSGLKLNLDFKKKNR